MISIENFLSKEVVLTQVRGSSKFNARQKGSLIGLGLKKIGSKSILVATPEVLGMFKKVQSVVSISLLG